MPIFLKLVHTIEKELLNSFYEADLTLILEVDKGVGKMAQWVKGSCYLT